MVFDTLQEIRTQQLEDFLQETGGGEEMDCSDEDETPRKRSKMEDEKLQVSQVIYFLSCSECKILSESSRRESAVLTLNGFTYFS